MAQIPPLFAGMAARMRRRREDVGLPQAPFGAQISDAAATAHELRTPVSCMTGFAELLLSSNLTPEQREHAQIIAQSGHQLLGLIQRQLGGEREPQAVSCDLRDVAQGCVQLLLPLAAAKGLHLALWIDDTVPAEAALDGERLRQILLNLVGNAIKFTNAGGVDIELGIENEVSPPMVRVAVIDSGIGIAPDRIDQIFHPFTQADTGIAARFGGSGLGLAITQRLTQSMGGTLVVHSQPGVGSNFTLHLPIAANAHSAPREGANSNRSLAGERVLVAEDDGISRRLLLALASTLGLEVSLAATGEGVIEAVRAAKEAGRPFRAVLMDLNMPGPAGSAMGGLETTRRLRAAGIGPRELPVIALTAACAAHEITACYEAGMQAHMAKPVTALALARELARYLPGELEKAPPQPSELLLPFPGGRSLQDRYLERKEHLFSSLRRALAAQAASADWNAIIGELHKISGVAAHFGEANLGETARRLEERIRTAASAGERQRELRRAWPFLMQVA